MDNKVVNVEEELTKDMGKLVDGDARVWTEEELPVGLIRERISRHVAAIMDGNRRWAKKKDLEPVLGNNASSHSLKLLAESCCKWGIKVLTVFAFSTGNWVQPQVEIDFLMNTFEMFLRDLEVFIRNEVRVSIIGDTTKLPIGLQDAITKTSEATKNYTKLHVILAINYGGREDIIQACQSICRKVNDNLIEPKDIIENLIKQELETKCTEFPYPDLLIRTSGEHRLSNFLMWQLAYTELHFEECLWPDFGEKEFVKALRSFQGRLKAIRRTRFRRRQIRRGWS
ncbi:hypothetical protein MKW98_018974 [Papaver atlanticum]|uniref:Alkyl transferase n=1 Tax=Papaver atlanticum TaxID=357466 RepID=A0AAD4XYG7_9MAGN|nr:hypothetical protein MKW98_018974 [Papaver atlanticum]